MFIVRLCVIAVFIGMVSVQAEAEEILAKPVNQTAPAYPVACIPTSDEEIKPETVTVNYSVTKHGLPQNVRVVQSTNVCFNDTAIAAIRGWKFEPRRIDGVRKEQENLETSFTFVLDEGTKSQDFDARPIRRIPPEYPERCFRRAKKNEIVILSFTVTEGGTTKDIEVIESTNSCLDKASIKAVEQWRYSPRLVTGEPTERRGVQTQLRFQIGGSKTPPELRVRNRYRHKILRLQRKLDRKDDVVAVLQDLERLETEYGDKFSRAELTMFYQLRARARIEAGDYKGALDDLRFIQSNGYLRAETMSAVNVTILELERAIAAQEAAANESAEQP